MLHLDWCDHGLLFDGDGQPVSRTVWLDWLNAEPAAARWSPEERELRTLLGV